MQIRRTNMSLFSHLVILAGMDQGVGMGAGPIAVTMKLSSAMVFFSTAYCFFMFKIPSLLAILDQAV